MPQMNEMINPQFSLEGSASRKNGVKRLIFALFSIILQVVLILINVGYLAAYAEWIAIITRGIAILLILWIYNKDTTSAMKMPWLILIMAAPILGTTLYILIGQSHSTKKMRERYEEVDRILFPMLPENRDVQGELEKQDRRAANIAGYLNKTAHYPTYRNTDVEYYDDAAVGLEAQIRELRKAEKFIFMEYHAIENAGSWAKVERVLVERARAGVDVRVFYDDMGSIGFINNDFVKLMESKGIRCRVFNPFTPGLNIFLNHRDHRKITVIDGKVGFTGGYNMANEYFHVTEPYGFWKDTGVRLTGDAVKSLTVTFLEMWNAIKGDDENDTDFEQYLPDVPYQAQEEGFVIPYADSPIDGEQVGENVYISIAEYAKDYVWFVTPYLILTDEMIHALGLASKRGVDVRVITPGIPDKKMVYSITRSYYHSLVRNGVRIYEFTPGFCHCKMSIADDWVATCGTINLDYRSLYHHFENGCLFCGCNITGDIRKDFESMMAQSREVTQEYMAPEAGRKLLDLILRLVAPLL